jgi:outer membrane receptor for monomeric catechols
MKSYSAHSWFAAIAIFASSEVHAQSTDTTPKAPVSANSRAEIIMLSPFEVTSDQDVGYQAGNTTAGSRLNRSLKDTAAAVMVLTPEFLSDMSATSLADMIGYASNMQIDMFDTTPDAGVSWIGGSDIRDTLIRVRGLPASTALDFFETGIPIDTYNTERVELSSGPNSVLFGVGSAGGLVNLMSKQAHLNRPRSTLRLQVGEWDHRRFELDHNQVIVKGRLALRLNGLHQESGGWRRWMYNDARRGAVSLRAVPWSNTTATVSYEKGLLDAHQSRPLNAYDAVALWQARGAATKNDAAWTTADRSLGINRVTAVRSYYATFGNGASPVSFTTRNAPNFRLLESTYEDLNVPADARAGLTHVPSTQIPYRISTYGPGASRETDLKRLFATVEQRFGSNVTVEFAYNRENSGARVEAPAANSVLLTGDPNTVIPNPDGVGSPIPNPKAGALYLEGRWVGHWGAYTNEVVRGSIAWQLNLGKWGKHHLAGMIERGSMRRFGYAQNEVMVDANGIPISDLGQPEIAANQLYRRHYFTPGDLGSYYAGNAVESVSILRGGREYRNTFVNAALSNSDVERTMDTLLLATQSSFLDSRLVLTAGIRGDRSTYDEYGGGRLPADHPDVRSGRALPNSLWFNSDITKTTRLEFINGTAGLVYHTSPRFSVFYNHARNNIQPHLIWRVLPDESLPPAGVGETDDAGFMLNLIDGKVFLRATAFQTSLQNASGGSFAISLSAVDNNIIAPSNRILDTLLAANRITAAEYSQHLLGDAGSLNGMSDVKNRGYEVSVWSNLNRNLTAMFNASYTKSDRSSIVPEFDAWYVREKAFWLKTPGAGALVNDASALTVDAEAASVQRIVDGIREFYSFGYGERPYKANASFRYTWTEGRIRGAFVGGGIRWQTTSKLGRRVLGRTPQGARIFGETYVGPEDFKMDGFAGYRRRASFGPFKSEITFQINVTNLTDEDELMPMRYNALKSGYAQVQLQEPRKVRFTLSAGF